jgi:hypothetical protein
MYFFDESWTLEDNQYGVVSKGIVREYEGGEGWNSKQDNDKY